MTNDGGSTVKTLTAHLATTVALLSMLIAGKTGAQAMSLCVENSPERRGELGCSIVESKSLPDGLKGPLYWHIDKFDSPDAARAAAGPASVAFEAAGTSWLMTIETQTADHHDGTHVTQVGPLQLPRAPKYAIQVNSSRFAPGMYSLAHQHSGVEAFYVIEGEQCLETPTQATILRKGETLAIPTGIPMRVVVTGSKPRHVLAIIVHDATQPATTRMEEGKGPQLVACK